MQELFKVVWEFSKASVEHAKNGFKSVSPAEYMVRLKHCFACDDFIEESKKCGVCGCNMYVKAQWQTSGCPLKTPKWKPNVKKERTKGTGTDTGHQA